MPINNMSKEIEVLVGSEPMQGQADISWRSGIETLALEAKYWNAIGKWKCIHWSRDLRGKIYLQWQHRIPDQFISYLVRYGSLSATFLDEPAYSGHFLQWHISSELSARLKQDWGWHFICCQSHQRSVNHVNHCWAHMSDGGRKGYLPMVLSCTLFPRRCYLWQAECLQYSPNLLISSQLIF